MRVGLSSYTYTWAVGVPGRRPDHPMTSLGLLQRAAELGVPVVQFADNLPLHRLDATELGRIAECAAHLGISIEIGTRGIGAEHLAAYLTIARQLRSPLLRVVVDGPGEHIPAPVATAALRGQRRAFEHAGVVLALENHDRYPAAVLARMVRDLGGDWVGVCLDTVNSFGALEGPGLVVDVLAPLTVNVHVKDFVVRRPDHQMGFVIEGRPVGQGQLDVGWLLSSVADRGRQITAVIELWTPPADTVDETVAIERRWAEESVVFLRQLLDPAGGRLRPLPVSELDARSSA